MSSRTPPPSASLFRPSIGPVSAWCRPPCPPCSRATRHSGAQPVVLRPYNDRPRRMLPSLEQRAFDELRDDGRDLDLHVPLLSRVSGSDGHVLQRELDLD